MVEFLKINLDGYSKSATIRLSDDTESILQAQFDCDDVVIHRLNFDRKPKCFEMTHEEASAFAAAWTDYQARVAEHKTAAETRLQTAINDAKALAASVYFDYEPLNITMDRDGSDASWLIEVKALSHHDWVFERNCHDLVPKVQEMLDYIKSQVEYAEKNSWNSHEWQHIIPSYRRVFPLEPERCQQCGKNDLPLNQETKLCVRCIVDNEQAAKKEAEQGEPAEVGD